MARTALTGRAFDGSRGATIDSFDPDDQPTDEQLQRFRKFGQQEQINALEIAILSNSKRSVCCCMTTRLTRAASSPRRSSPGSSTRSTTALSGALARALIRLTRQVPADGCARSCLNVRSG